jgi:uncharacterized protein
VALLLQHGPNERALATTNRGMEIEGMFQLSDQQDDEGKKPPSNPSVVNKAYPGLVLVPPSDRTILRRRLLRGALLLVAVIWAVSTFMAQPPDPGLPTNCQSESGQPSTEGSPENCDSAASTPQTAAEPSELSLTQVSQMTAPVEASPLPAVPQSDPEQPQVKPMAEPHASTHAESTALRTEPRVRNLDQEKSAVARLPEKPVVNQESDLHLAEQGDPFAQYRLGRQYARRDGSQTPESASWYKKAFPGLHRQAEAGNAQAMYVLGVMYAYGRGVSKDSEQARRWLTHAVEHKITAAQPVLANLPMSPRANSHLHAAEQAKPRKQPN